MDDMTHYLGGQHLPDPIEALFVHWCVWEQARPALAHTLAQARMPGLARQLKAATSLGEVMKLAREAHQRIAALGGAGNRLPYSAAEAAIFEFRNLIDAADEGNLDSESAAFFAMRLAGWAGWAAAGCRDAAQKQRKERQARESQMTQLRALLREVAPAASAAGD